MSTLVKYRIREVAKDFDLPVKTVMDLVAEFYDKPKNNMQVLEEDQLNLLFDVITQRNQITSLEQVFAVAPKAKAEEAKPAQEDASAAPAADSKKNQPAK